MDDPIRAATFLDFIFMEEYSDETKAILNTAYKNEDMSPFVSSMRLMVQEYLLGGPCKTIKLNDFIFGYKNDRLDNLYDQFKFQQGKEVAL